MLPFSSGIIQIAVLSRQSNKFSVELLRFSKPKGFNLENDHDMLKTRLKNPFRLADILQKDSLASTSAGFHGFFKLRSVDLQISDQTRSRVSITKQTHA